MRSCNCPSFCYRLTALTIFSNIFMIENLILCRVTDNMCYTRMCIIHSSSPVLRMQLQVGLISCAAVTRGKKPLPLLVEYIESR